MSRLVALSALFLALGGPATAQVATSITADTSPGMATGTNVSRAGAVTTIAGGARAGGNLFHSFNAFSLGFGETARWTAVDPAGVANIVNRVTGGSASSIAGMIDTTQMPGASFFFINPAGVFFASGAQINVAGAAYFSTAAGGLRFADGARFSAVTPNGSTFSVAAPESFGFLGGEGNLIVTGVDASFVRLDGRLSFTAANIGVQNSTFAPRSLDLVTTNSRAATLAIADPLAGAPLAGVILLNSSGIFVTATGGGAPSLRIATGAFSQSGGSLTSSSFFAGDAGDLVLRAQTADITGVVASNVGENVLNGSGGRLAITVGSLRVGDGGQVSSSTFGRGAAGNVVISATDMLVERGGSVGSDSVGAGATGRAGAVQIDATNLTVRSDGSISSTTNGQGDAGSVTIKAMTMLVDGGGVDSASLDGSGRGGLVTIDAGRLDLRNGGGVGSFTSGTGDAGNIQIKATDFLMSAGGNVYSSSLSGRTTSGAAGDISITASNVSVRDSYVSSDSSGGGHGGVIDITGTNTDISNGFISSSGASGNAGDIFLKASGLRVTNDSLITSRTFGAGAGGQVTITADQALFDFSEVDSRADRGSTGAAGNLAINVGRLTITNQTAFSTSTFGPGAAGRVAIVATTGIVLSGGSQIQSASSGGGDAGQVSIKTGTFSLDDALVTSTAYAAGNAGGVSISAVALNLKSSSIESVAAPGSTGNGGTIDVVADTLNMSARSGILTATIAAGNAGKLHVAAAGGMTLNDSYLASSAADVATGAASSIAVETSALSLINNGFVVTSSVNPKAAGSIVITSTGPVSVSGNSSHISSANTSSAGGAAGSIIISGAPILVAESGYISTDSFNGAAGDISLFLPANSVLRLEGRDAAGVITTSSGPGRGGKIVISKPLAVISNGGEILALGQQRGANVQLNSAYFIRSSDRLNLLSVDGTLVVDSQAGDVSAGVAQPQVSYIDASGVLRGQCRSSRREGVVSELTTRAVGPYATNATSGSAVGRSVACR